MNLEIKPVNTLNYSGVDVKHDLEVLLPLSLIREHTRTDDVATVSDTMLMFYRKAAVQAAEEYTGLLLADMRFVNEEVPNRRRDPYSDVGFFKFRTKHVIARNFGYYYGQVKPIQIALKVGSQTAMLPYMFSNMFENCCNPCDPRATMTLGYHAGYSCESEIPAAVGLGALKYIAHLIGNPGDITKAQRGNGAVHSQLGADNPAVASGALEIWRTVRNEAI